MYKYRYYVGQGLAPAEKMVQNLSAGASPRPTILKFKHPYKLQFERHSERSVGLYLNTERKSCKYKIHRLSEIDCHARFTHSQ